LLDALDYYCTEPYRNNSSFLRLPISGTYKIKGVGDVLTGRIEQGKLLTGEDVVFIPSHSKNLSCCGKIFTIEMHHKRFDNAKSGDNVGMNIKTLDKNNLPKTGDVMIHKIDSSLIFSRLFIVQVQTLETILNELKVGYSPIGFVRSGRAACKIKQLHWKIGRESGGKMQENPFSLKSNEMAEVTFEALKAIVIEQYANREGLSRIAFLEGNSAVMLGKIIKVLLPI